jgi:hypothetical protein
MPHRDKPICRRELSLKHFYPFVMHLGKFSAFGTDKMIVVGPAHGLFISGFFIPNFELFCNADFTQQLEIAMHRCNADFRRYLPDLIVQVF